MSEDGDNHEQSGTDSMGTNIIKSIHFNNYYMALFISL